MTRAEWLDYFETVNGRKPSVQEMADALKAGEFVNEAPAKAGASLTNSPAFTASAIKHQLKLKIQLLLNLLRLRQKSSRQALVLYQQKRHQR